MRRRHFLVGVGAMTTAIAGCTGGDGEPTPGGDDGPTEQGSGGTTDGGDGGTPEDGVALEELPEIEELLAQHHDALDGSAFVAEERVKPAASGTEDAKMTEKTVSHDGDRTLVEGDDVGRFRESEGKETVWLTDNVRIEYAGFGTPLHTFYPDGTPVSYIDGEVVDEIVQIGAFERVDVTGDDEQVYVFEATGAKEEVKEEASIDFRSVDVRVAVSESEYVRSMDAEITLAQSPDAEQTSTAIYEYEVTKMGDVTVPEPAFVDDAIRIEAYLTEDRSAVVLEHTGGPGVSAGSEIIIQDADAIPRGGPTLPETFDSGDVAYVYWTATDEAGISLGEEPAGVARKFALPSDRHERNVYLRGEGRSFEVRFGRRA